MKFRSKVGPRTRNSGAAEWGTVAEAILAACSDSERHALCVAGPEQNGRLFVEGQHVVHAEYGDEVGLSALVEMMGAGRVRLSAWSGAWPGQQTLRLGPLALLAKSAVPGAPPPLPTETENSSRSETDASRVSASEAFGYDERTTLWSRAAKAQVHDGDGAANVLGSSGVFRRGAARQSSEAALPPGSQADVTPAAERHPTSRLPAALFTGALTELGLADVLQILQWLRRSAVIRITRDDTDSHIWCESGEVIDAESGRLRGEAAVYRMLSFEHGSMIAELRPSHRARTIFAPTPRLVLEAARRKDVAAPLRRILGGEQRHLRCARESAPRGLRPEELKLLRSFTTPLSAHDGMQGSELGDFETLKLLARWVQTGYLIPVGSGAKQE